jgi:FkbM family methyltransferase
MTSSRGEISPNKDLVFDVGLDVGQDTANYLKRGYRVVAFEANPDLVDAGEKRFKDAIQDGRLEIVDGAIVPDGFGEPDSQTVEFYVNGKNSAWGTIVADRAAVYEERTASDAQIVSVPRVKFVDALRKYGVPHYLKTDIEGVDTACLEGLSQVDSRPSYLSMESDVESFERVKEEMNRLGELGYTAFQIINQKDIPDNMTPGGHFERGGSGDFGEWLPDENWKNMRQTLREYRTLFLWYRMFSHGGLLRETPLYKPLTKAVSTVTGSTVPSWHDTHARHERAE